MEGSIFLNPAAYLTPALAIELDSLPGLEKLVGLLFRLALRRSANVFVPGHRSPRISIFRIILYWNQGPFQDRLYRIILRGVGSGAHVTMKRREGPAPGAVIAKRT